MSKDKAPPETPAELKAAKARPPQLMYIGPTVTRPILLTHRGVYRGLPGVLNQAEKEVLAVLAPCFVPLSEAAGALRELEGAKDPGQATRNYKAAERVIRSLS